MVDLRCRTTTFGCYPADGETVPDLLRCTLVDSESARIEGFAGVPCLTKVDRVRYRGAMYFDRQGLPISFNRWSELMNDDNYRRVGWDEPHTGVYISTVWLGMNHGCDSRRPLIFETMVFNGPWDQGCRRYTSEIEATCGHLDAVDRIRQGREPFTSRQRT